MLDRKLKQSLWDFTIPSGAFDQILSRLTAASGAEDAARYQWLREQNANLDNPDAWTITKCDFTDKEGPSRYWVGSDLDAAIDAARRARGEGNE